MISGFRVDPGHLAVSLAAKWEEARDARSPIITIIAARAEELRAAVPRARDVGLDPIEVISGALYNVLESVLKDADEKARRALVAQRDNTIAQLRLALDAALIDAGKRRTL